MTVFASNRLTLEEARQRGLVAPLAAKAAPTAAPSILARLVSILTCKTFHGRLSAEEQLTIAVAERLRHLSLSGSLRAAWTHIPNQADMPFRLTVAQIIAAKKRAMGAIPGAPDFVFHPGGFIELKAQRRQLTLKVKDGELKERSPSQTVGQPSTPQRIYRDWCEHCGVPYEVCTSIADVLLVLQRWKVLD